MRELLRILRPPSELDEGGRALVYVWAFEQGGESRRRFEQQDSLVPWNLRQPKQHEEGAGAAAEPEVYFRYYHLFKQGELEQCVAEAGGEVLQSGYDRDNHYCVIRRGAAFQL